MSRTCAIVGGGLAGFVAYVTLRHGGIRAPRRSRCSTRIPIPSRRGDRGRRPSASGGCARRATATAIRARSQGWPRARRSAPVRRARSSRPCATATGRASPWSSSGTSRSCAGAAGGTGASRGIASYSVTAADGGFAVDDRGTVPHVLIATGHPGLACRASSPTIRGPSTRTSRTTTPTASRSWEPGWPRRPSGSMR